MRSADMDVVISNNRMSNNRPRGILLSGAKRGLIENNIIHVPGNGIYISGDANYWYESGPVENVEICGNVLDHCAYVQDNAVSINFDPVILKKVPGFFYHGKANIHDNTFLTKDTSLVLKAHSVPEDQRCSVLHHSPRPERMNWIAIAATTRPVIRMAGPVMWTFARNLERGAAKIMNMKLIATASTITVTA